MKDGLTREISGWETKQEDGIIVQAGRGTRKDVTDLYNEV